jgi:hypothetical protein
MGHTIYIHTKKQNTGYKAKCPFTTKALHDYGPISLSYTNIN